MLLKENAKHKQLCRKGYIKTQPRGGKILYRHKYFCKVFGENIVTSQTGVTQNKRR